MPELAPGRRLYLRGTRDLWPWWVGPDPAGRWHVALALDKPHGEARTTAAAVCGTQPPQPWQSPWGDRWMSWKYQEIRPARGAACCADCLWEAQRHDWPRPAGLVAFEEHAAARPARGGVS